MTSTGFESQRGRAVERTDGETQEDICRADALLEACREFYGERLTSFCVFGSVERETMTPFSDVDGLTVIDGLPSGRRRRIEEFRAEEAKLGAPLEAARKQGVFAEISPCLSNLPTRRAPWVEKRHCPQRGLPVSNPVCQLYRVVPLIMVPYLVRVLGPAGYGAVAFAQGFINYLMLFVGYGFDLSATRKISVMRENLAAVS